VSKHAYFEVRYFVLAARAQSVCEGVNQGYSANKRGVGTHPKKLAILKQLRTHFKKKHEKGVETPFSPH